ncbi:MAG: lactonase family protein, partial [Lachnospiraceae bacterium]|nr:lactonase family protein [Lachnospiraceae bacterium]
TRANVDYPKVAPGHGPRHCVFGPKGDRLYLINEMGNTIYVYSYDCETAETKELQVVETVPSDWPEWTTTAAIKIHPNGKILYGSNRGHDSLITCRIDEETGLLEKLSLQPIYGHFPRDFDIDSTGKWLICGGQYTDNLVVFSINEEDGALTKVHEVKGVDAVTGVLLVDFE